MSTPEHERLEEARTGAAPWKAWGPYLSERQWGTVREDYSHGGDAWSYFPHDHARSRAYRWGEDGIAGVSDDEPAAVPRARAVERRRPDPQGADVRADERRGQPRRGRQGVLVLRRQHADALVHEVPLQVPAGGVPVRRPAADERARAGSATSSTSCSTPACSTTTATSTSRSSTRRRDHDDLLMRVTAHNRGPEAATLHLLPTLWFRNTWHDGSARPSIAADGDGARAAHARARRVALRGGRRAAVLRQRDERAAVSGRPAARRTRRTRSTTTWSRAPTPSTRTRTGTKVAAHHVLEIPAGGSARGPRAAARAAAARSTSTRCSPRGSPRRTRSTPTIIPGHLDADAANVMRQSLAGLLWGKQYYEYDVHRWLREQGVDPWGKDAASSGLRNVPWFHFLAGDVISMPDKWEYPWFAAWDLAFHCAPLGARRHRLRQGAGRAAAAHALPAPERPDPGLRVELLRRQPAGHRVGGAVRLRARGRAAREGRPRVPRPRLRPAADQLHVVGQPQGPRRPQPVPGRLPRARQHRHLRPLGAAARRRDARAGRRHRLDGPLLPVDAADRGRAGARGRRLRRHGAQVPLALPVDRDRDEPAAGRRRSCGTRRTASTTT